MKLRTCLAALVLPSLVMAHDALAGPREDVLGGAQRCARIADDRNFLDCYYGAAQPLRAQLGLAPAPSRQVDLVPPAPGMMSPSPRSASGMANTMALASYRMEGDGTFTVTLANGQVWSQLSGDDNAAHFSGPASAIRVTIAPSGLGADTLAVVGEHGIYKVRRQR